MFGCVGYILGGAMQSWREGIIRFAVRQSLTVGAREKFMI